MPNADKTAFSLENALKTDPNSVYEAFVTVCSRENPTFRHQIEFMLRKGYPMAAIKAMLNESFTPAAAENIFRALVWKKNMLIVGEYYWFHDEPERPQ